MAAGCAILLSNVLQGVVPTVKVGGGASSAAAGYDLKWIADGIMARACRIAGAGVLVEIFFDALVAKDADTAAAFDIEGETSGPGQVLNIEVAWSSDAITYFGFLSRAPNRRGDWIRDLGTRRSFRYWKFSFTLASGAEKLDVGLLVLGQRTELEKMYSHLSGDPQHSNIVNGPFGGELHAYQEVLELTWSPLDQSEHEQLMVWFRGVKGSLLGFTLIRNTAELLGGSPSPNDAFLYGQLMSDSHRWEQDPSDLFYSHAVSFRESDRAM
jgi:hypothetical protein